MQTVSERRDCRCERSRQNASAEWQGEAPGEHCAPRPWGVTSEPPRERPGEPGAVLGCAGGLGQPAGQRGRQRAQTLHGTPQATGRTWGLFSTNQSTSVGDRPAGEAEVRAGAPGAV